MRRSRRGEGRGIPRPSVATDPGAARAAACRRRRPSCPRGRGGAVRGANVGLAHLTSAVAEHRREPQSLPAGERGRVSGLRDPSAAPGVQDPPVLPDPRVSRDRVSVAIILAAGGGGAVNWSWRGRPEGVLHACAAHRRFDLRPRRPHHLVPGHVGVPLRIVSPAPNRDDLDGGLGPRPLGSEHLPKGQIGVDPKLTSGTGLSECQGRPGSGFV